MNEINEKEKRRKNKQERGAITLYVLLTCLFFVFILTGVYIRNINKLRAQEENIEQIQENYAKELSRIDEIYEELINNIKVTLSKDTEEWASKIKLTGWAQTEEDKKIIQYVFTTKGDESQINSSEWKTPTDGQSSEITENQTINKNGTYYFYVKDNSSDKTSRAEIEVKNIDDIPPIAGTVIAKEQSSEGNDYEFNTITSKDVYVKRVNGSDNESGHFSTTMIILKDGLAFYEGNSDDWVELTESGRYTITLKTLDVVKNESTSEEYVVIIDKMVPVVTLKHNDENGEVYDGTWTKDNLYAEINMDTSGTDKIIEKYQYSENKVIWNDVKLIDNLNANYTTTFPMSGDKPDCITGPINGNSSVNSNGTYYFEEQEDGTLKPNNSGVNSSTANSYFEIDLTNYPDINVDVTLNVTISSERSRDIGYATINSSTTSPAYNSSTGRFIYVSGAENTAEYTKILSGGSKYYLHVGYRKDRSTAKNGDTFIINSISLKSQVKKTIININEYDIENNRVTFTLNEDLEKELYFRAVYTEENSNSNPSDEVIIKIDKTAPVIQSATVATTTKIDVKVKEDGSGMNGYYISTDSTTPTEISNWTNQILKEFTIENLSENTTYYLWVRDNVGNISASKTISIGTANYSVDNNIFTTTLNQAINAASDGSTIKLLNDYTDTSTAIFSKNITFNIQSYTLTRSLTITISEEKEVEITGTGKITSGTSSVRTITNSGTLTLSDSITIENQKSSTSYSPIYTNDSDSVTNINDNVKISGYYYGVYNASGTVNINGGYIESTYSSSSSYGIYNYSDTSKIYMNSGTVTGYYGIYNYGESAQVEMTGGKVIGTGGFGIYAHGLTKVYGGRVEGKTYGIYCYNDNILTMGREEDELSITIPAIYGETYGIYMKDTTYTFNFYNGVIISKTKTTIYNCEANLRKEHMTYTYFDEDVEKNYCTILTPTVDDIVMEATPTEYTNGNVTVKITYPYKVTKQYSEDQTNWTTTEDYIQKLQVEENKIIYARAINDSGVIIKENQININNIDKEVPTVTVTPTQTKYIVTDTNYTIDLNININASDTGVSGLDVMQYAWAKEGEEIQYIDFTNEVSISKTKLGIGAYNLYLNVTDKAGNKAGLEQMRYNIKLEEPVCKIGTTKYLTIQEAVETCSKEAGDTQTTIEMIKSTDEEFATYEGQNIILDLAGFTIGSSSLENSICTNNAMLQIIDTSSEKTGKIESLNKIAIENNGTLTIGDNSTSIDFDTPTIYGKKIGITNNNVFNFYDGKIQGTAPLKGNVTDTPEGYGPVTTDYSNGITTMQLGIVSGYVARINWVYYITLQDAINATKTNVTDDTKDTVTILTNIQLEEKAEVQANRNMILDLNGYEITINSTSDAIIDNLGQLKVIDSTSEQAGKITGEIGIHNNGILQISGGTIDSTNKGIENISGKTIINGGTVIAEGYGIYNSSGIVEVVDGIVNGNGSIYEHGTHNSYGIYNDAGNVLVQGGIVSCVPTFIYRSTIGYAIYNGKNGNINISGGTISVVLTYAVYDEEYNYNLETIQGYGVYNLGTLKMTDGSIIATMQDLIIDRSYVYDVGNCGLYNVGMAEIIGGSIANEIEERWFDEWEAIEVFSIQNDDGGNLIIGNKLDENTQKSEPNIYTDGGSSIIVGIGVYNTNGKIEFFDGTISGNVALLGNIDVIQDGFKIENNMTEEYNSLYLVEDDQDYVVQVDEKNYHTLNEALESIQDNEQKTIKVIKDFCINKPIEFNKNVILDLNGYTVTNYGASVTNIGMLEITDSTDTKGGSLQFWDALKPIENKNEGNIRISGGSIINKSNVKYGFSYRYSGSEEFYIGKNAGTEKKIYRQCIYNAGTGTIEVTGGTVEAFDCAIYNASIGEVNISGGNIKSYDNYVLYNNTTGNITIKGGTITGNYCVGIGNRNGNIKIEGGNVEITGTSEKSIRITEF